MNTIFDNLTGNVDLSIFGKSNTDPKTPLRRHYLSLVGLLEYVDILNGDLTGRNLPAGITEETVKGMIIHCIGDLDTMKAMSEGGGPEPEPDTHEYVDLGLPSGTLWATENIKDHNGNELYFAWGETQGYTAEQVGVDKNFTWDGENNDYAFGPIDWNDRADYGMKKYNKTDGKTELESGDDAATDNWGDDWKMPTKEQFEELIANTEYEWTEIDGVQGGKFMSKVDGYTDKFLFFPAVGDAEDGKVVEFGVGGNYWSVSLNAEGVNSAWGFYFDDGYCGMSDSDRCCGYSVRPVRASRSSHDYVNLGLPSGTLWATENIKDHNGNELYFAWGETQGYTAEQVGTAKNFTWEGEDNDYAFGPIDWNDQTNYGMKKYNNDDGLTVLEPGDDAATDNWGDDWKMPTKEQFEELIANTEYEWTEIDGVQGGKFMSKVDGYTDKFLFFPAVGLAGDGEVYKVGDYGRYWSVSLYGKDVNGAWYFCFDDGSCRMSYGGRYYGCSVRPVRLQNQ